MKTKELLAVLNKIKPGISRDDKEEQSTHFIFMENSIVTYNDKICISHEWKSDLAGSVKADDFFKVISSVEEEDFELTQKNDSILIESESIKAELPFLSDDNLTIIKKIQTLNQENLDDRLKSLPENFIQGVSLCLFSVAKDSSASTYLNCVNVQQDHIMSSDNYRISHFELDDEMKDSFLIPLSEAVELVKFDVKCYALDESWIHFSTDDGVVFSARRFGGEYKGDYEQHFDVQGVNINLPAGLKSSVDLLGSICSADFELDKSIEIKIDKKKMVLRVQKERGWVEKTISLDTPVKKKVSFTINPIFFSQILQKSTTMILGENTALFFNEGFRHIVGL